MIREASSVDHIAIGILNEQAFGQSGEAALVERLREDGLVVVELVASEGDEINGHVLFSRLQVTTESGEEIPAAALGPVAVSPALQSRGIGSSLIRAGLDLCRERGVAVVIVLGHARYYPRFGFSTELGRQLTSPYSSAGDSWMALEMVPHAVQPASVVYPEPWSML